MDFNQKARLNELTDLIAKEHNPEKFSKLIAELNFLLDGLKKPVSNAIKMSERKTTKT